MAPRSAGPPPAAAPAAWFWRCDAPPRTYSAPSIPPYHPDHDALHDHFVRAEVHRLHAHVRRLQSHPAIPLAIELLHGRGVAMHQRDHHLTVLRCVPGIDDHVISIPDLLVDHRIAPYPQHVVAPTPRHHVLRHRQRLLVGDRFA